MKIAKPIRKKAYMRRMTEATLSQMIKGLPDIDGFKMLDKPLTLAQMMC